MSSFASLAIRPLLTGFVLAIILSVAGCGSGNINTGVPPPPAVSNTQIRIGDAAVDEVIDFPVTIASPIKLQPSGTGAQISVAVGPNHLELSHMAAKLEALAIANIPAGSYTSADITINTSAVTFVSPGGIPVVLFGPGAVTVTVPFSPAITIGGTPSIINIDFSLANSLLTSSTGAIVAISFTPSSFTISSSAVAAEASQQDDTGEIEALNGTISSVTGASFGLNVGQSGAQLTLATDGTTQFTGGLTNLASSVNQVVKIEGVTKSDGTLFAKEIEGVEALAGSEINGTIIQLTPSISLSMVAQDGNGAGMDTTKVGASFTADLTALTAGKYLIDTHGMDLSGLAVPGPSFPFDAATIHAGQRVEVDSLGAIPAGGGVITTDKVRLEQQAFNGTVANFVAGTGGNATFDLTLPLDSYLTTITGQTVVHVFQQAGTDNRFGTISNTNFLRVRGLLFWTGTTFNLIARRITP